MASVMLAMTLLFFGGLPLGLPPAEPDPIIAKVAPENGLVFVAWTGRAKPDPKSTNQFEQLLAEEEVRKFGAEVCRVLTVLIEKQVEKSGPQAKSLYDDLRPLVTTALTHSTSIYVSKFVPPVGPEVKPDLRGGMVVELGDQAEKTRALVEKYSAMIPPDVAYSVDVDGQKWHGVRTPADAGSVPIVFGVKEHYLVVGVGEGEVEAMLKRAQGNPPAWLTKFVEVLPIERRSTLVCVNVRDLLKQFLPLGGPKAVAAAQALGLGQLEGIAISSGLDGEGLLTRTLVKLDGPPLGIFELLDAKPLAAADLAAVPRDVSAAAVARVDLQRIWQTIVVTAAEIEPKSGDHFKQAAEVVQAQFGLNLVDDLLKPLGGVWSLYATPGEGGVSPVGLTLVVSTPQAERLVQAQQKLLPAVQAILAARMPEGKRPKIDKTSLGDRDIHTVTLPGTIVPVNPSWCITDKELIVGLTPQCVKTFLGRTPGSGSLADVPQVAAMLKSDPPLKFFYQNTPEIVRTAYPLLQGGLAMFLNPELAKQGAEFNMALLPSSTTIVRHLRPATTSVSRTPAGIEFTTRQSLPLPSVESSAPVLLGFLLPAVQSARESARRVQSSSNLFQLSLAMFTHESGKGAFPAAYSVDKQNKPLLSWRVHVLPYLDEAALYKEFHLDEPWDSEHNKKLISRMPPIFRSPSSKAKPGKTVYLTVRGEDTVFPGAKGVSMADIRDGASNTILMVEGSDESAVVWTKPDDFIPDPNQPQKGLGQQPGAFLAAFADGVVRTISRSVDAAVLKALLTRSGSETVDTSKF